MTPRDFDRPSSVLPRPDRLSPVRSLLGRAERDGLTETEVTGTALGTGDVITEPLAPEPVGAEPLTAEPLTAEPLTEEPLTAEPLTADPRRQRVAVTALFVSLGVLVGSWLARTPDVKSRIGLSDHGWGLLSTAGSIGAVVAILSSGLLIARFGSRRMLLVAGPGLLVAAPLLATSHSAVHLVLAIVAWGLVSSLLQAPLNGAGVRVEARYGRPLMNTFHAGFSIGALVGALLSALAVRAGLSPDAQLVGVSAALAVLFAVTLRWLPADPPSVASIPGQRGGGRGGFVFSAPILLLAAIGFCSVIAEGTSSQWAAIYVSEALGAGGTAGALAYACFAGAMMIGRLSGDRVVHALGRRRFLRVAPWFAAAGTVLAVATGTPWAAFVGFVLVGLGVSCVTPTVYGTAGTEPGVATAPAMATMSLIIWPAFLAGPVIVGSLSDAASLRVALLVIAVAALLVTLLATKVRRS